MIEPVLDHPLAVFLFRQIPDSDPWYSLGMFSAATALMIWRFGALERSGFQGTVLGTLIMPYCSGLSNLVFAFIMGRSDGNGILVIENCLVNNVTNLTLLLGLPALFWGLNVFPEKTMRKKSARSLEQFRINRLSLLLSLSAAGFFTGLLWVLTRDGGLDFNDGLVLTGGFLFWQVFHVYDVLKENVQKRRSFSWLLPIDLTVIVTAGWGVFHSIDRLVAWVTQSGQGLLTHDLLGWLSGLLMVLPNALLAVYYACRGRAEVVVSSQVGDGHICIPLCIGIFALFRPVPVPEFLDTGVVLILAAAGLIFLFLLVFRRIPRLVGGALTGAYIYFLYQGFFSRF